MHLLIDRELVFAHLINVFLLKDDQISVSVIAAQNAVILSAPVLQPVLDGISNFILHAIGIVSRHFFQIVDDDYTRYRPALLIEDSGVVIVRDIHPVGDSHDRAVFLILLRADQVAEHLILMPADLHQTRIGGFPFQQPRSREVRNHRCKLRIHTGSAHIKHLEEGIIGPHNTGIREAKHCHRKRKTQQSAVLGILRVIGNRLNICRQLLGIFAFQHERNNCQNQRNPALRCGKHILPEIQRGKGEGRHKRQINEIGRSLQWFKFLI